MEASRRTPTAGIPARRRGTTAAPTRVRFFAAGVDSGTVAEPALVETSGIVASRRNAGVLWAHNDSGDSPRIFALDTAGRSLGTYAVQGAEALDWEDIAAGPGPEEGSGYLYIGDIGDNPETRASVTIYRVLEPAVDPAAPADGTLEAERMDVTYEDRARNSETLLFDPESGALFTVHKTGGRAARIYRIGPFVPGGDVTATMVGMVRTPMATAGDISADGREILIRSYVSVQLWKRPEGSTIDEALGATHCRMAARPEPQGEAIAFGLDGAGYYTLSEGAARPLWFYARQ